MGGRNLGSEILGTDSALLGLLLHTDSRHQMGE